MAPSPSRSTINTSPSGRRMERRHRVEPRLLRGHTQRVDAHRRAARVDVLGQIAVGALRVKDTVAALHGAVEGGDECGMVYLDTHQGEALQRVAHV